MTNLIAAAIRKYQFVNFEVTGLIGARLLSGVSVPRTIALAVRDLVSYTLTRKAYSVRCVGTHTVLMQVNKNMKKKKCSSKMEHFALYMQESNMVYRKLSR